MNPVTEVNPKMEYAYDAEQSSTTSREDSNEKMESSTKSAAKGIPHAISEVPRSLAKSEAEPRSGDASLPASSSIASLVKASHTERHLEIEDKAKSPLHTTSITVREPQGPLRGARNMVGDLTNSNHLDRLPTEIQLMIIQECIPECDASRGFSVSLDCNNKILLEEGQETQHTYDCRSQDGTTDLRDTMVWGQVQIPSCFSEIRHLAVPVKVRTHNIGFMCKMIFACPNLRSLISTWTYAIQRVCLPNLGSGTDLLNKFYLLLHKDLRILANFSNLQLLLTDYRSKELVYYMALESSGGENLNIIQNTIGNSERLEVNTTNATKIFFSEIESFIDKYCCEEPHLAELPEQLICRIDPDVVRGILRRLLTRKINELFNPSRAIADTEETQQLLEVVKNVFEQHKRSNPGDGNSIKTINIKHITGCRILKNS
ncbi:hypothetical protein ACHAO1_002412 [Botrytis cinerea]